MWCDIYVVYSTGCVFVLYIVVCVCNNPNSKGCVFVLYIVVCVCVCVCVVCSVIYMLFIRQGVFWCGVLYYAASAVWYSVQRVVIWVCFCFVLVCGVCLAFGCWCVVRDI